MSRLARLSIDGQVATPSSDGWDEARAAWNLVADQRPRAVALVESAADVAEVIRAAAADGLRVAVQATGHGAGTLGAPVSRAGRLR